MRFVEHMRFMDAGAIYGCICCCGLIYCFWMHMLLLDADAVYGCSSRKGYTATGSCNAAVAACKPPCAEGLN